MLDRNSVQPRSSPARRALILALIPPPPRTPPPRRRDRSHVPVPVRGRCPPTSPAHVEIRDFIRRSVEQLPEEADGVARESSVRLAVLAPPDPGLAGNERRELIGAPLGDDPPSGEDQDAIRQTLGLLQIVRREQDR